ncbi:MAG TPA: glycosyltransferase [Verrucomicrobiae bacterium]|nr:glycosyltransferase [Verrucomicrobiae bacterium]
MQIPTSAWFSTKTRPTSPVNYSRNCRGAAPVRWSHRPLSQTIHPLCDPVFRTRLYYRFKPLIPASVRMSVRRHFALKKRESVKSTWPIIPGSEFKPAGWNGWPDGKKFALVLTHDVEGPVGVQNSPHLMELERQLGFHSSFNFIPEGPYSVSEPFRLQFANAGFEVGVHDLRHDGKLYLTRRQFSQNATRINHYLKEWGAVGFRSGFMMRRLNWLHDLNVLYDASTFDTDPFEPQPDGCQTIFPYWISNGNGGNYVELPYTVPQDSTVFLLLREQNLDLWKHKLDWIAQNGGMALLNVHPDYMNFTSEEPRSRSYPAEWYAEFLKYVRDKYQDSFWNPLPRQLATWFRTTHPLSQTSRPQENSVASVIPPPQKPFHRPLAGQHAAVLLYSYYPADPRPRRAAEALAKAGMTVDLFCLRENDTDPKQEMIEGVNVFRMPLRKRREGKLTYVFQYASFLLGCAAWLTTRLPKRRYDLVHVHNMPDFLVFGALLQKTFGAKVILDLHDPMPELMRSIYNLPERHWSISCLEFFEKISIGFADLVLTPNLAFQKLFVSRGCPAGKIQIIMNTPRPELFDPANFRDTNEQNNAARPRPFKIMFHGLIAERHGLDLALEALVELRTKIPGVEFHIYGHRTGFMNEMDRRIQKLKLEDVVHYHGHQPRHVIAQAINDADIGIIPNRRSPFTELNMPTRIFEYLAMHKPVIVPGTVGIRDYFDEQTLLFFDPDKPGSLSEKLLWAYEHRSEVETIVNRGHEIYVKHQWPEEERRFIEYACQLVDR